MLTDYLTPGNFGKPSMLTNRVPNIGHRPPNGCSGISLHMVGVGKWTARDLTDALAARDRTRCGPVAPAEGLYLTAVDYPDIAD